MSSSAVRSAVDGQYFIGSVALPVKTAVVAASASGNTQQVAAIASTKIRVLYCRLMSNGTVNQKWQSATTDITGLAYLIANTGYVDPFCQVGVFETAAGEALNCNLSGNVAVGGVVRYVEIPA